MSAVRTYSFFELSDFLGTGGNGSDRTATDITHLYDAHKRRVKSVEADGTVRYNIFDGERGRRRSDGAKPVERRLGQWIACRNSAEC